MSNVVVYNGYEIDIDEMRKSFEDTYIRWLREAELKAEVLRELPKIFPGLKLRLMFCNVTVYSTDARLKPDMSLEFDCKGENLDVLRYFNERGFFFERRVGSDGIYYSAYYDKEGKKKIEFFEKFDRVRISLIFGEKIEESCKLVKKKVMKEVEVFEVTCKPI